MWALNFILMKRDTSSEDSTFPPFLFNTLRYPMAGLACLLTLKLQKFSIKIKKTDWPKIIFLSFLASVAYQTIYIFGLEQTKGGNVFIIFSICPIFVCIITFIKGKSQLNKTQFVSSLIALLGLFITTYDDFHNSSFDTGSILILISTLGWAFYTFTASEILKKYNSMLINGYVLLIGTFFHATMAVLTKQSNLTILASVSFQAWVSFFISGLGSLYISYTLYSYGIKLLGPEKASQYSYLGPPIGLCFALIFLDETVTFFQVTGMILILIGVYKTQKS